jgi:hypothetical protein
LIFGRNAAPATLGTGYLGRTPISIDTREERLARRIADFYATD